MTGLEFISIAVLDRDGRTARRLACAGLALLLVVLLAGLPQIVLAYDRSSTLEQRVAQAIYNGLVMSRDEGEPSDAAIRGYQAKYTNPDWGKGYSGWATPIEEGRSIVVLNEVLFPSESALRDLHTQYADNIAYGQDPVTGGHVFYDGGYIHVLLFGDGVVLRMQWARSGKRDSPENDVARAMVRWRFFVEEAVRLGILSPMEGPEADRSRIPADRNAGLGGSAGLSL
jgi:hypothetical protein